MSPANEPAPAGVSPFATLRSVNVSPDGSLVELISDQPFTYTSYKSGEPPKIIVDISQTVPGQIPTRIEVNRGNIRRIELLSQPMGSGALTRAEIQLVKDVDYTAATDPSDRKKLQITLVTPEGEAKQPQPEAPLSETKIEEKTLVAEGAATAVPEPAAPAHATGAAAGSEASVAPAAATGRVPAEKSGGQVAAIARTPEGRTVLVSEKAIGGKGRQLNAILRTDDGVEFSIQGGVLTFNSFKLTRPDRIVVDIFGVKNAIPNKSVPIGSFGVSDVRIGSTADKVRVVLDAADEKLLPFEVIKSDLGVKVRFKGAPAVQAPPPVAPPAAPAVPAAPVTAEKAPSAPAAAVPPPPVAAAPVAPPQVAAPAVPALPVVPPPAEVKTEVPATRHEKGSIEALDFNVIDGISRITVKLYGTCQPSEPTYGVQGLSLSIKNCQVPRRLQRTLETSQFGSPVLSVTPYQVKAKTGYVTKVLVRLQGKPPYVVKRKGDLLVWDIANPAPLPTPKLPPAPTAAPAERAKGATTTEALPPQPAELVTEIPAAPGEKIPGRKVYTGRRVTLEFSDADVRKIFQLIAEVSNLNFLISDDVSGTISLKLVNVPWDQALDVILEAKGLGMQRVGNIVQIKPKAKIQTQAEEELVARKAAERTMELRTAVFEVNYAPVGDVATQFAALKSDRGVITKDERTSRVIVRDVQPALDDMRQLLKTLDTPEKQVMIEARIVEASSTFTRDLGVQWGLHYKDGSASIAGINTADSTFGGVVSTAGPGSTGSGGLGLGMSFGKLTNNIQIDMRLAAAATVGQVKIISTPKVVTLNNKAAKISQGQSIPYQTTSAEGTKTEFVEAALTLEVTPHITPDGSVSMKIKASNNSPGTGSPPPINKKEATTELVVSNGETTVIGGIYVDSDTESDTGVPFLADIPLLGWLFKSNSKQKTKTELLIFITPKVVL